MLDTFNTTMSLLLSLLSAWAIMSRRFKDGIVIKIGLSFIALGFLGSFSIVVESAGPQPLAVAHALVHIGLLICAAGYLLRIRKRPRGSRRRASDWVKP